MPLAWIVSLIIFVMILHPAIFNRLEFNTVRFVINQFLVILFISIQLFLIGCVSNMFDRDTGKSVENTEYRCQIKQE